jgi:hypothetical protein
MSDGWLVDILYAWRWFRGSSIVQGIVQISVQIVLEEDSEGCLSSVKLGSHPALAKVTPHLVRLAA